MQGLMLHSGARAVTLDELRDLPTPLPLGRRHRPMRFDTLVDTMLTVLEPQGATRAGLKLGINGKQDKIYGFVDLAKNGGGELFTRSIGFRTSTDKSMALSIVVGAHVFICDNGAFSGDEVILRHLNTIDLDLVGRLGDKLPEIHYRSMRFEHQFIAMQQRPLADDHASKLLVDAMLTHALLPNDAAKAAETYFAPNVIDLAPEVGEFGRTEWALHNCMTRQLRDNTPGQRHARSVAVGKLFGI